MSSKKNALPIDVEFEEVEKKNDLVEEIKDENAQEVLCGVVLKRYPVVSYNPFSNILVYDRDGMLIQTNAIVYDGSGYVEVE